MGWIICEFCGGKHKRRSDARDQYFCGFECRSRMKRRVYMRRYMRERRGQEPGPSFWDLYPSTASRDSILKEMEPTVAEMFEVKDDSYVTKEDVDTDADVR